MPNLEKPWYSVALTALLTVDVPWAIGISPVALSRDVITLEKRLATEGESFLTKTLPNFGKAFDLALQGRSALVVSGFKKRNRRSALPAFLQALLGRIFTDDGWVKDQPCIKTIRLVRQFLFWCKKIEKGYNDESLRKAIDDLVSIDSSLPELDCDVQARLLGPARAIVEVVFRDIPELSSALPKHGPGAVASGGDLVTKRKLEVSYARLESVFRPIPWFRSLREAARNPHCVTRRPKKDFGLSKIAFVEKDSSGPRVIGLEPAEYMWCQQAIKSLMYNHLECGKHFARGHVNFTDQTINQGFTSLWSDYDTLDMSKASDRVSLRLVEILFGKTKLWPWLFASRTPGTVLPNGELLWYKKFAPMGSAVCFPVESVVFYVLACASLAKAGMPLSLATKRVFVYGDDLIIPHGFYAHLERDFSALGLKFNEGKCCISGKFRESCGVDSYDGVNVTPVRMKRIHAANKTLPTLIPVVKHVNNLMLAGYRGASLSLRRAALQRFPALKKLNLPISDREELPILYWYDDVEFSKLRIRHSGYVARVKGWYFRPERLKTNAQDEMRYLRESLALGGPVGRLISAKGERKFRVLDKRFTGKLSQKWFPVQP